MPPRPRFRKRLRLLRNSYSGAGGSLQVDPAIAPVVSFLNSFARCATSMIVRPSFMRLLDDLRGLIVADEGPQHGGQDADCTPLAASAALR